MSNHTRYNPQGTKLSAAKASAGRANADGNRKRRRKTSGKGVSVLGGSLEEFRRACDRMLAEHIPGYQVRNFAGVDVTAEVIAQAPPKRGKHGPRPVSTIFWKSRPQEAVWG